MNHLILLTVFTVLGFVLQGLRKVGQWRIPAWTPWLSWAVALFLFASTSFVIIDQDKIGHMKRIFLASDMPAGQIIAFDGQKGPQARLLGPGFHLIPLVNVLYEVEQFPVVRIPKGTYGFLTARGGAPLRPGEFIAKGTSDKAFDKKMLDAEYFLKNGGQKGPQLNVLRPGTYRINRYLFDVKQQPVLDVKAGEVAVIKSNVAERNDCPSTHDISQAAKAAYGSGLSVPLVPKGCIGVWDEPMLPGRYYLNREAYTATLIPTRARTWVYAGGYEKRRIDLTVSSDGQIHQQAKSRNIPIPKDAADLAVVVTVEGWRIPLDVRVVVQVDPGNAPRVVASVGGLQEVEDRIVTPVLRSIVRNVGGAPGRKALDLINKRDELESLVEEAIFPEGFKAGVAIKEVRFGDPAIPPELLVARQRQQLADQLENTYKRERVAQEQRIAVEKSRSTADQQGELVRAQIAVQVADLQKQELKLRGEGEKLRLIEIAEGQRAQTQILGEDRVYQLAVLDKVLEAAVANSEIVKIPNVLVQGAGGGFEGAAAILGASNLMKSLQEAKPGSAPKAE